VIEYETELFDTNSEFDTTTNKGRFTPTRAGYYHIEAAVLIASTSNTVDLGLFKNGTRVTTNSTVRTNAASQTLHISDLVYLNGSTDYIDARVYQNTGGNLTISSNGGDIGSTTFQAFELL